MTTYQGRRESRLQGEGGQVGELSRNEAEEKRNATDDSHKYNTAGGDLVKGIQTSSLLESRMLRNVARPVRGRAGLRRVTALLNCILRIHGEATRKPRSSSDLPGEETQRGHIAGRKRHLRRSRVSNTRWQELDAMAKAGLLEGQSPGTLPWSVGNPKYRRMGEAGSLKTHISGVRVCPLSIL